MARIFKRGKTWYLDYGEVGGRRLVKSTGTTSKKLAEETLKDYEGKRVRGEFLGIEETKYSTFADWCVRYMELKQGQKAASSRARDKVTINKHLVPHFGNAPLQHISREAVEAFRSKRAKAVKASTANKELAILKAILQSAVENRFVRANPAAPVKKLAEEDHPPRYFTADQTKRLVSGAKGDFKAFIVVALNSGLRRGELFGLKWESVDLEKRQIVVEHAKGGRWRAVPINNTLHKALKDHPRHKSGPYVFSGKNGGPWKSRQDSWRSLQDRIEISPRMRIHDMRHTFISNLVMAGVDLRTVMELAGHKDIKTTMRYAHLAPGRGRSAVDRLDGAD